MALGIAVAGPLDDRDDHLTVGPPDHDGPRTLEKPDPTGRTGTPTRSTIPLHRSPQQPHASQPSARWIEAKRRKDVTSECAHQPRSDLRYVALASCRAEGQALRLVDGVGVWAVEEAEDAGCRPGEALVPIHEGVDTDQGRAGKRRLPWVKLADQAVERVPRWSGWRSMWEGCDVSSIYFLADGDAEAVRFVGHFEDLLRADHVLAHDMITVPHLTSLPDLAEGLPVTVDLSVITQIWPNMPEDPEGDLSWMAEPIDRTHLGPPPGPCGSDPPRTSA